MVLGALTGGHGHGMGSGWDKAVAGLAICTTLVLAAWSLPWCVPIAGPP